MTRKPKDPTGAEWACFRFSVVGQLLSDPPAHGELKTAIRALAERTWRHPVSECNVQFAAATVERWYYIARRQEDDPVCALRRAVRKDSGKVSLAPAMAERLHLQYRNYPHWSYQLQYDDLAALVKAEPSLGPLRCYSTVQGYMQARGWPRRPRFGPIDAQAKCTQKRDARRERSAALKLRLLGPYGTSISTTHRSRCSPLTVRAPTQGSRPERAPPSHHVPNSGLVTMR